MINAEEGSTNFNPTCEMDDEEQVLEDKKMEKHVGQFFHKLSLFLVSRGEHDESTDIESTYQYNFRCFFIMFLINIPKNM